MKTKSHTIRSESNSGSGRIFRSAARILLCLMLTFALVIPMAAPSDVYAAAKKTYKYSDIENISGIDIDFAENVITDLRLAWSPTKLNITANRSSLKLNWTGVKKASKITGYIIVRKDPGTGIYWKEIDKIPSSQTTYTDETANVKNTYYKYSVLAYKNTSKGIKVSTAAGWAGAVTTNSKKKNVDSVTVSNIANVVSIMEGSCAQTYLTFPDKAKSTYMRWWSSDDSVATVSNKGLVTGINNGTATIFMKTHTGSILSYDVKITTPGTAQAMIDTFSAWMGYSRINGKQNSIIDIYNSVTPWPKGYKMKYSDAWCDATVTAAAIKTGNIGRIGRECSVPRHIDIFKKLKIWKEDGTIRPRPGDIIVYSWHKFKQPNNASASHIGLVVKVEGNEITAIEGNRGIGVVDTRTIPIGWGCIRGYARPKYVKVK